MGYIFEALRPHLVEFCEDVNPFALMRCLPQLSQCDRDEVTAGFGSHGRACANDRLWQRMNGKVTVEEFLIALRQIGNQKLAAKIEGSSTSATNSRHVASSPACSAPPGTVVTNNYTNCSISVQHGNNNVMERSPATPQELFDSEVQSIQSDYSYEVVTEDASSGEFDTETLRALGVVGRADHSMTTPDQCSADDDETYEKQLAVSANEIDTSHEIACLSDDLGLQPPISWSEYNGRIHSGTSPSDACSSSGTEADVATSSRGYVRGSESQQKAELVAEDETLRKIVIDDVAVQPVETADDSCDGEQVSVSDNGQSLPAELMVNVVTRRPEGHEIDSVNDAQALALLMAKDTSITAGLINSDAAASSDELKSDTCALPASEPLQQGPSVNSDSGDQSFDNSHGTSADECRSNCWLQRLRGAMVLAAQVGIYFYRNATV